MKNLGLLLAAALLGGCISIDTGDNGTDSNDRETSVTVPRHVLAAARAKVPGFVLTSAEMAERDDRTVYDLEGKAGGNDYEIHVTPAGRVVSIDH